MTSASRPQSQSRVGLILLAFIAFISLGLPDGLLGVAMPSMLGGFGFDVDAIGFMLFAGMAGYLSSSFFSGQLVARLGVGRLLAISCALTGGALLGYALAPEYWVVVGLSLFSGLGAGAIDAGLNTYIAANHGEGLMQWLHASFGVGISLGPIIMTTAVNGFGEWRLGYAVVGTAQIVLAVSFALTASIWARGASPAGEDAPAKLTDYRTPIGETLRQPRAWLSLLLFFVYTGIELAFGHFTYILLNESRGVPPETAGLVAGVYWGMFTVGRILAGLYAGRISAHGILRASMLLALAGALLVVLNLSQGASIVGIALVGFAVAPIFPAMVSTTAARVGRRHAANTIGIQISAAGFGGTLMPTIAGILAARVSLEAIPVFLTALIVVLIAIYTYVSRTAPE